MIKSFLICAATVVAVGCSTAPSSDINKSYDVSRKVTLPDVSGAKPYSVVVGLLTLKGDRADGSDTENLGECPGMGRIAAVRWGRGADFLQFGLGMCDRYAQERLAGRL